MNISRRKIITATAIAPIATASSAVAALIPSSIQSAGLSPKPARHAPNFRDTALLKLGDEFETNWVIERRLYEISSMDEERERQLGTVFAILKDIANKIRNQPATTMEGLRVKARAISWCHSGEVIELDGQTTDVQLANSIVNDLLNITNGGDRKHPA